MTPSRLRLHLAFFLFAWLALASWPDAARAQPTQSRNLKTSAVRPDLYLERLPGGLESGSFSPRGEFFGSVASEEGGAYVFDTSTWRQLRFLRAPVERDEFRWMVQRLAFSPKPNIAATLSTKHKVGALLQIWDLATGEELRRIEFKGVQDLTTYSQDFAFSKDGERIAAMYSGVLMLWNVSSGALLGRAEVGAGWDKSFTFLDDGMNLIVQLGGSHYRVLDAAMLTWRDDGSILGGGVCTRVAPNGQWMAWAGASEARLYSLATKSLVRVTKLPSPIRESCDLRFSADSRHVAVRRGAISVWDTASGALTRHIEPVPARLVESQWAAWAAPLFVSFVPGRQELLVGARDDRTPASELWDQSGLRLGVWDFTRALPPSYISRPASVPTALRPAISGDARRIAWVAESAVMLCDFPRCTEAKSIPISGWPFLSFSADGKRLIALFVKGRFADSELIAWDVDTGKQVERIAGSKQLNVFVSADLAQGRWPGLRDSLFGWLFTRAREAGLLDAGPPQELRKRYHGMLADLSRKGIEISGASDISRDRKTFVSIHRWSGKATLRDVATGKIKKEWKIGQPIATLSASGYYGIVRLMPDAQRIAYISQRNIVIQHIETGKETVLQGGQAPLLSLDVSADGNRLISAADDGSIRISDLSASRELGAVIADPKLGTLVVTPEGYFRSSREDIEKVMTVRLGARAYGISQYRDQFHRPAYVQLSLEGRSISNLLSIEDGKPPRVAFVDLPSTTGRDYIEVEMTVEDTGGGIGDIFVLNNRTAVHSSLVDKTARDASGKYRVKAHVELVNGKNELRAIAYNGSNKVSSPDNYPGAVHDIVASAAAGRPSLYALVIGIQQFRNQRLNLTYPVADAELLANTLRNGGSSLFAKVDVEVLTKPEQTTKQAILDALAAMKHKPRAQDFFVLFVATHGHVDEPDYFLVTSNVGSLSSDRLKADAISQEELRRAIANIPAQKKLVALDTCYADRVGQDLIVGLLAKRGTNEEAAVQRLSRSVGAVILSASKSNQEALEGHEGHGLFSYVLAQALSGKADTDKNGYVSTTELINYVDYELPIIAEQKFKYEQFPMNNSFGQVWDIVRAQDVARAR